jgi:Spy/CpxP family protein refolding chaperone
MCASPFEVRKLFTDPKTDDATLLAKEKELNALRLPLMDKKAEMKVEWRKILTAEQIQMLDRIHRHHRGHHHRWRHYHGHRGPMGKKPQSKPAASMSH